MSASWILPIHMADALFGIYIVKLFYPTLQVNPVFPLLITSSEAADSNVGDGSRPVDISAWVSLAGGWVEEYKITQKKTTQKSKALRKQLN